ncbi:MAG: sulfur carrier protein ThiS [Verrucomicrobia bacterium]|nr:sulfur carrier protein ThiS [Verrucomicrobiota bacterium]
MTKVTVNGKPRAVTRARNVSELIDELKLVPATLLIEHNGTALHRSEWSSRSLKEGDQIELVRVVAGG